MESVGQERDPKVTAMRADPPPKRRRKGGPRKPARLDGRTREARRARELQATYSEQAGGELTADLAARIRRAAELTALAEAKRAQLMRGDEGAASLDDLVRLERAAVAAVRALRIDDRAKAKQPSLREYLASKQAGGS
jgi:hypothetical protein